ncbi:MAG: diguanylate cyclase domain-containing protein [Burkholderiales bacterium]
MAALPTPAPAAPPLGAKIALAVLLAAVCAFVIASFVHRTVAELDDALTWSDHTYDLITRIEGIENRLLTAENAQLSYTLTGDASYLALARKVRAELDTQLASLRVLSADNPAMKDAVNALEPLVARKAAELESATAARARGLDAAAASVRASEARRTTDELRQALDGIKQQQWDLLEDRLTRKRGMVDRNALAMMAVAAISALFLVFVAWLIYADVVERRRYQRFIAALAFRDPLTGLPNRAALEQRLAAALAAGARHEHPVALVLADLDNFKQFNDVHGRTAGDAAVVAVAGRLADMGRGPDLVARMPDDRFMLLLADGGPQAAAATARRIIAAIGEPLVLQDGTSVTLGASIGISIAPADGTDPVALLGHAETAMLSAKAAGKQTYRYYQTAAAPGATPDSSVVSV